MENKVTVIVSFYNEEKYLMRAVDSILNQTHKNVELILINDYSTDNSPKLASSIPDKRVKYINKTTEPKGVAGSRILAMNHATGEYLTFQDADDTSETSRIEKQLKLLTTFGQIAVVGCGINLIRGKKNETRIFPKSNEEIRKGFNRGYNRVTMVGATLMGPTDIFRSIPFQVKYKYMEDWDQLLRMHESGNCVFSNLQEALYNYFLSEGTSTTTNPERIKYNVFLRYNEQRRKKRKNEFDSVEEFFAQVKSNPIKYAPWLAFYHLKRIQHRMRNYL